MKFKSSLLVLPLFIIPLILPFTKVSAISLPSEISGLQLWLDASQPDSFYKDAAKTIPATLAGDKIAAWADKSGNGFDATNTMATSVPPFSGFAAVVSQPVLGLNKDGGYPAAVFSNSVMTIGNPALLNVGNTGSTTIFVVFTRTSGTGYQSFLYKRGRDFFITDRNNSGLLLNYLSSTKTPVAFNESSANLFVNAFSGGVDTNYLNGIANRYIPGFSDFDLTRSWMIGDGEDCLLSGYIQAILIYNRKLSAEEINSVSAYLSGKFSVTVPNTMSSSSIIYEANSLGYVGTPPFAQLIYNSQATKIPFINGSVDGRTTSQMITSAPTITDPLIVPGLNNILVGWEGVNDTSYAHLVTYYTARKAAGWKVIAVSVLPHLLSPGEPARLALNDSMRTDYTQYADALADVGGDPVIGTPTNYYNGSTYSYDGTHPTAAGLAIIAKDVGTAIDAMLYPLTSITSISTSTTATSATIGWTTNASSSSIVDFDITSNYATSSAEQDNSSTTRKVTGHSVTISGLQACSLYHYRVRSNRLSTSTDSVYLKDGVATSTDATFITSGCTGNAAISTSTNSQVTTASGGSLSLDGLSLTVPTSYSGTTTSANFQVKQLDSTAFFSIAGNPTGKTRIGTNVFNLKALIDATTTLSTFSQPLTITLPYTPSDVTSAIVDPSTLKIYRYDGSIWNVLTGCLVDTSAHTVTCQTSNFSDFGVFADPDTTLPTPGTISFSGLTTTSVIATTTGASDNITLTGQPFVYHNVTTGVYYPATNTSVMFTGLNSNTTYVFEVIVQDLAGNMATSTRKTITTLATRSAASSRDAMEAQEVVTNTQDIETVSEEVKETGIISTTTSTTIEQVNENMTTITNVSNSGSIFSNDLSLNSKGNDVTALQQFLVNNGYLIIPEGTSYGYFGALTRLALIKYQQAKGITPAVGYFGPKTRSAILNAVSTVQTGLLKIKFTKTLKKGMADSEITTLQQILKNLPGIYPQGIVTGYFGNLTLQAVKNFQLQYNIVSSPTDGGYGIVGPKTREKLNQLQ